MPPARLAAPAACAMLMVTGAGLAVSAAGAAAPTARSQRPRSDGGDLLAPGAAPIPLAGPRSAVGFQRALGLVTPALMSTPSAADAARRGHPRRAPDRMARAIANMTVAGDRIATLPYLYGGGHGSFTAAGYDCSGSVSYVLHAAGLLSIPLDSNGLESFGEAGPGREVTIYADAQHAFMTIGGRRFDTIAFQETGTRWSSSLGSTVGYIERHPAGM